VQAVAQQLEEIFGSSAESGKQQPRPDDILKAILDLDLKQVLCFLELFINLKNSPLLQSCLYVG
jgi:hypothetical protein